MKGGARENSDHAPIIKLRFDRGTILLTDPSKDLKLAEAPGVLLDPRVNAYRAPASTYPALKRCFSSAAPDSRTSRRLRDRCRRRGRTSTYDPIKRQLYPHGIWGTAAASLPSRLGAARLGSPSPPCTGRG